MIILIRITSFVHFTIIRKQIYFKQKFNLINYESTPLVISIVNDKERYLRMIPFL